jgi:WD40 repeat protein
VLPVSFAATPETVQLVDRQGEVALRLAGHTRGVNAVAWAPDFSTLASASWDGTVRLWNGAGECVRVVDGFADSVESVDYTKAGDLVVASRDRTVWRIDAAGARRLLARLECAPSRAAPSPDGGTVAVATEDDFCVLLDAAGGRRNLAHPGQVHSVAWSRDGRLATACEDGAARVFDAAGAPLGVSDASPSRAVQVAWHPDGLHLAVGLKGEARVLDADLHSVLSIESSKEVTLLAWTPEGDLLAVGSGRGDLAFWGVLP